MLKLPVVENKELCGICKGSCCKWTPGLYIPEDFGSSDEEIYDNLRAKMVEGTVVLAGRPFHGEEVYIPSPRGGYGFVVSYNGRCMHLTDEGCSLGDKKPSQCKALTPAKTPTATLEDLQAGRGFSCEMPKSADDPSVIRLWKSKMWILELLEEEIYSGGFKRAA